VALLVLRRHLAPDDRARPPEAGFDARGTLLLALTLAAYALAATLGRGQVGVVNLALLLAAVVGAGLFVVTEKRVASPLLRLAMLGDPVSKASLATNAIVSTVVMSTLVVGPFYLALALGLDAATTGFVMSVGPLVVVLTGVPAGRLVDRAGAPRVIVAGLIGMAAGAVLLALLPTALGVAGYLASIAILTAGYAFFQTANNTAVMAGATAEQRGVISGVLNLSRNLGLITGASVMGAVFAYAVAVAAGWSRLDITSAPPEAVAAGMRITFAFAAMLLVVALALVRVRPPPAAVAGP
jgi:MFS family permease